MRVVHKIILVAEFGLYLSEVAHCCQIDGVCLGEAPIWTVVVDIHAPLLLLITEISRDKVLNAEGPTEQNP
jgi:hypothetical protein